MAIQVNGTQVIGNSRELTNIASVDATSAAAMSAAGVGGSNVLASDVVLSSSTYTFTATGTVIIQAIGAGGSGAIYCTNYAQNGRGAAVSGGAGGGYVRKAVAVTAGDTISITIGAGGARTPQTSGNEQSDGNAGGTTTVTGSNLGSGNTSISLTAGGGGGGKQSGGGYSSKSVTSNTGGSASGGDVNNVGGTTSVTLTTSSNSYNDGAEMLVGICRGAGPTILGSPEAVTIATNSGVDWLYRSLNYGSYPATGDTGYSAQTDTIAYAIRKSVGFTDSNQIRLPLPVFVRRSTASGYGSYMSDGALSPAIGAQPLVGAGGPALCVMNVQSGISYGASSYGSNGAVFITYKDE